MKVINTISYIFLTILLFSCSEEESVTLSNNESFVRFHMLVDSNGDPISYGEYETTPEVSELTVSKFQTIKVPVALTSTSVQEFVLDYTITGNYEDYTISPEQLNFTSSNPTDTLYLNFTKRWLPSESQDSIIITLNESNNSNVSIGYPRETDPMNQFKVVLSELTPIQFGFPEETNRILINGDLNETITFDINFDQGILISDIENYSLFTEEVNDDRFIYTITQQPFNDLDTKITYQLKLTDDLSQYSEEEFELTLNLNDIPNFKTQGNTTLSIKKEKLYDRDENLFPAQYWFDTSDQFYRNYGFFWWYDTRDERCEWKKWNAFSVPIEVDQNHLNAIEQDGIYYHAFQIGFLSPIDGRTTNPFGLKSWFKNEATDADNSPGFNIVPALEFFPTDDTSGTIQVVNQNITISNKNEKSFIITLTGEGEYKKMEDENWEMTFELTLTNDELFEGGSQTAYYYLYNFNNRTNPEDYFGDCFPEIDLNNF